MAGTGRLVTKDKRILKTHKKTRKEPRAFRNGVFFFKKVLGVNLRIVLYLQAETEIRDVAPR